MDTNSASLFSKKTQAVFYNFKQEPVQRMLDFDYLCNRETPSVAALVTPGSSNGLQKLFFGTKEIFIPIYGSLDDACKAQPQADVMINFASMRSAYDSTMAALRVPTIRTIAIIAEGVPELQERKLAAEAIKCGKIIIGPATVGGIQAGAFKIGDTAGMADNIIACKLYRPGSVGFVSKSGGLSNEMYNILSQKTDGLFEGIAIGGDVFPGSTFLDHVLRFERIPEVKMIVILGELGGRSELDIAAAMKEGKVTKPLVAWVTGTCASIFPTEVQFGHAGAKSGSDTESAAAKNAALREAGALVPPSFEGLPAIIEATYKELVAKGVIVPAPEVPAPVVPVNFASAFGEGRVRRATGITSSICDDRGEEPTYNGCQISDVVASDMGIGDVIGLLWFKRRLPKYATKFIEMVIILCADHGPCVSGAHNTIVASRAGKDVVSSVCSGLLTIGPRFGGAIDDAARYFKAAKDAGQAPHEFVESMKKKGLRISGIGHRIKSADNLDKRVVLMKEYAKAHFPSTAYLDYALEVEKYTLKKAANLVLNVDGCIGTLFCDLMASCASFSAEEMTEIVEMGCLNGLFLLARTIGLIGHALDQKRMRQPLYRHPWDDVMYCD
mmetsp:Transcript_2972/g.7253  ORF Transcript_2972/g.7253 Transcript_2972/m.7253 type:complete len:612 (-) Transcript_2972:171-2006(-)|eukprot:CAMPEP_0177636386 /NCGR_PEP_ID=MMETSP0447-20121125/4411_1 /TAXON_ID=0 /ORGANISM="Stygamoeba regulata, Strain BSH-02190019" /LENGTH=611 /DNA_ID=CAMNT_0019138245 /DNA_START=51 /DNA_END=1886 /DNA_ORIENTATION=+